MPQRDWRQEIDDFLASRDKRLAAQAAFVEGTRPGQMRSSIPVEVSGEITNFKIELLMTPDADPNWLRILLLYGYAVWRLCLKPEAHSNSFNRPADLPLWIDGPHHHSWADNRRFATRTRLPKTLENARILPTEIVSKDQAFRWFLDEIGIEQPDWQTPIWPQRTRLL